MELKKPHRNGILLVFQNSNMSCFFFTSDYIQTKNNVKDNLRKAEAKADTNKHRADKSPGRRAFPELSSHLAPPTCALRRDAAVRWRSVTCSLLRLPGFFLILQLNKKFTF